MATTFLGAVKERYAGVADAPRLWTCRIPDGEAATLPNALLEHEGEQPVDFQADGAGGAAEVWNGDGCRIVLFGEHADDLDALAHRVMAGMQPNSIQVVGRAAKLYRRTYRLEYDPTRSAEGRMVFRATIVYAAEVD